MPTVRSGDADIFYDEQGQGDPLLLIMGYALDSRMWMLQVPVFSGSHRTIVLDNRGVGSSSCPPGPWSMEQMAGDALAVLDACEVERAHVVAISMGGAIAQQLALKAPERVRSLTLAATWAGPNPWLERVIAYERLTQGAVSQEARAKLMTLLLFTPAFMIANAAMVESLEAMGLEFAPSEETLRNQREASAGHDVRERLSSITAPTQVLVGKRDVFVPPELSREIADAIPGATLELFETGHAFIVEEGDAFNRTVLDFVAAH